MVNHSFEYSVLQFTDYEIFKIFITQRLAVALRFIPQPGIQLIFLYLRHAHYINFNIIWPIDVGRQVYVYHSRLSYLRAKLVFLKTLLLSLLHNDKTTHIQRAINQLSISLKQIKATTFKIFQDICVPYRNRSEYSRLLKRLCNRTCTIH